MKSFKSFILIFALTAMIPLQIFAQKPKETRCFDSECVSEILKNLKSPNDSVVDAARNTIVALADEAGMYHDSRMISALKASIVSFIIEGQNPNENDFVISLFPKFCWAEDCREIMKLTDNESIAGNAIRAMGDIKGSGRYIENYIMQNHDDLRYKAELAYAVGKQNIASMEDELISWLNDADEPTKIEVLKALVVIRSSDKTTSIIKKGAKKLIKSKASASRIAGLEIMTDVEGEKAMPTLYKALKDKSSKVRNVDLDLIKPYVNQEVVKKVMKKCKKGDALVDAINWLGDIKDDSQVAFLIKQLSSKEPKIVEASIRALLKIDNPEGINAVKPMFGGDYQEVIKESMVVYEGNYRDLMNDVIRSGNDNQRLGALQIIESRPTVGMNIRVRELTSSNNQEVRDEAYKVLKLVVMPADADVLKGMLEYCDDKNVEDVQLAIKKAMKNVPDDVKNNFASTLKHVKPDKIGRYYKVFAYFGTEFCVDKLIDAYKNGPDSISAKAALLLVENESYKQKIEEVLK